MRRAGGVGGEPGRGGAVKGAERVAGFRSVAELVRRRAACEPERAFLLYEEEAFTYAQLYERACRLAGLVASRNPPHLGVLADNVPDFVCAFFACALAGGVLVGLNPTRRPEEVVRDAVHCDVSLVLVEERYRDLVSGFDTLAAGGPLDAPATDPGAEPALDDLFVLVFTSGTTAAPKAVRCSHRRLLSTGAYVAELMGIGPEDRGYCAMPLFHSNAQQCGLMPALLAGASLVLRRRFSARGFLEDVRRYGCTFFNYTGSPLSYILMTPERPDDADNPLRVAYGNEGSTEAIRRFARRFGCRVIDSFGATEGGFGIYRGTEEPPGSVGRAPPHIQVWNERDEPCPLARFDERGRLENPEECIGEIVNTQGAGKFEGYYRNPEATAQKVRGGVFRSGDYGYLDEQGYLYFVGRDVEWIRVEGENFPARPVEEAIRRFPGVAACAVYGVPDPAAGDRVMVALVLQPGASLDPEAFLDYCRRTLGPKEVPSFLRVVDALPATATHKTLKRELARQAFRPGDWYRDRDGAFRLLDEEAYRRLRESFERFGRAHLLDR